MRLLLAGLVGALLASLVFLAVELVRKPATPPRTGGRGLVALPAGPGASPDDLDDPAPPPGASPRSPHGQGLGDLLSRMQQQMQQAFGGQGGGFTFRLGGDDTTLEAEDAGDAVVVTAKVKDAVTDKFDIRVEGRTFTLRGQKRLGGGGVLGTMSFQQSVLLPAEVDQSKMTSEVKDGVLRVRLPKK